MLIRNCLLLMALAGMVCMADAQDTVNVAAAISLKGSLEQARTDLEKAAGAAINFSFGASGVLASQIRQGAPIDVFISADHENVDKLNAEHLLTDNSIVVLATNRLVLIVPESPHPGVMIAGFADLSRPEVKRVAIGEPKTVPAGEYAMQALTYFKLADSLEAAGKLIKGENVAAVLTYADRGDVDAAIVYSTDAAAAKAVRVVAVAPECSHEPVRYVLAQVQKSSSAGAAAKLRAALLAKPFQDVLIARGFHRATATQPAATESAAPSATQPVPGK